MFFSRATRGMELDEAMRLAAAEGLKLVRSSRSASGFKGVYTATHDSKAQDRQTGKQYSAWVLGENCVREGSRAGQFRDRFLSSGSLYECALAYARWVGPEVCSAAAAEAERHVMSAEEAVHSAEAEGLVLRQIDTGSGYKGVKHHKTGRNAKPYQAEASAGYKKRSLGYYATAQEAALVYARHCLHDQAAKEGRKAAKHQAMTETCRKRKEARLAAHGGGQEGLPATAMGTVQAPLEKRPRTREGAPVHVHTASGLVVECTPGVGFQIEGMD